MKWICLIALCSSGPAWPQAASNDGDSAGVAFLNYIHVVNNLDKTLAFYHDVFELDSPAQLLPNPGIPALVNSPGARLRHAVLHLPNTSFGLKLAEFSGAERKPVRLNISDPGAGTLVLRVRDLDRVVDAAKNWGAEIITPSGAPVKLRPTAVGSRAILMRDPDGYLVEGEEVAPSDGWPSPGNVQTAGMRFAMADRNATLKFYGDLLGLRLNGGTEFRLNPTMNAFAGTPQDTQLRSLNVTAPGTNPLLFYEFKDLPHTQFHHRVPDPGSPAVSFRVKNLDGVLERMRAVKTPIVSARGRVVQSTPRSRSIFVEDPNGIHVEFEETVEKRP
jgi:catechol 2,3-dioxygenase-like lactoylglutathione lyase family enzyme